MVSVALLIQATIPGLSHDEDKAFGGVEMSKKPDLSIVRPDDRAPEAKSVAVPDSLGEALEGSRFQFLAAMRNDLVKKIEAGDIASNSIGSTYKVLEDIDRKMRAEMRSAEGGSSDDDLEDEDFNPLAI